MKYIRQFGIILLITFIGEIMHELIPMFIPAAVGLIDTWEVLSPSWLQFVIVTVVTTVVVMAVSGLATQAVIRLRSRKAENK